MTTVTNDLDSVSSSKSLSQVDAEAIARDWIAAWNKRDLDAILKHYDGNVKFLSPRVIASFNQQRVSQKKEPSLSPMTLEPPWLWQKAKGAVASSRTKLAAFLLTCAILWVFVCESVNCKFNMWNQPIRF